MNKKNIGDIMAYWNVEHTKAERLAHLDKTREFLEKTGLDRIFKIKDVTCPDWDNAPGQFGYPLTRIDLVLKKPYGGRVYRHSETKARVKGLTVIHLTFGALAGVYNHDKHVHKVLPMTSKKRNYSEKEADAITKWRGWDDTVCEYYLRTDGKHCAYKCRNWRGWDGEPGDSFNYARDWNDVHNKVFDAVYRMVHNLKIGMR